MGVPIQNLLNLERSNSEVVRGVTTKKKKKS